jgi:nucleotide-binding universal stress UspA family protein
VRRTVAATLLDTIPAGRETLRVCGTRVRPGHRGLLSGTVSEHLLRVGHCPTLALRVVQPGLLGLPREFLIPLAGHPRGLTAALPFLVRLATDVARIHLLRVVEVTTSRYRRLPAPRAERLSAEGRRYLHDAEEVLSAEAAFAQVRLDSLVVVSDDVPKEIVIAANRTKSRLILMGASERNLSQRFFYGNPIEQVLRETPCDVAVYRAVA